jgi:hypothetical protein
MASPKTAKPAPARREEPVSKVEQLGSGLVQSNTPSPDQLQAPPDTRGEDDRSFFTRHPEGRHRFRLPFPDEFSAAVLSEARIQARGREVVVLVVSVRDASGIPSTRARGLVCLPGGTA